jgi:hypothetical protein
MAIMVACKGKETSPYATITLGQKIGMQVKSSRRNSVLKRKTPLQEGANQAFPSR